MLKEFMQESFETNFLKMVPMDVSTVRKLSDLPRMAFTVSDSNNASDKVFYDILPLDESTTPHHFESLARRVCDGMYQHNVSFDSEQYRWHADPVSYLTACIRASMRRQEEYVESVIRKDGILIRLPKGAMLQIVDTQHRYLVDTPLNRDFLVHVIMLGKCTFFGEHKAWFIHHPHVKPIDVKIMDNKALLKEAQDIMYNTFGFLKGHIQFSSEIGAIMTTDDIDSIKDVRQ